MPVTAERTPYSFPSSSQHRDLRWPGCCTWWAEAREGAAKSSSSSPFFPGGQRSILSHFLSGAQDRAQATHLECCWHSLVAGAAADTWGRDPWNPRSRAHQPLLTPLPWAHSP